MSELKTQRNRASVKRFLDGIKDDSQRQDARELATLMEELTGDRPEMWGTSIVGFGTYRYKYESGRQGQWFLAGFSPRKNSLTLYIMSGFAKYEDLLAKLGKHKTGKSCLYIKRLDQVDRNVLRRLVKQSIDQVRRREREQTA